MKILNEWLKNQSKHHRIMKIKQSKPDFTKIRKKDEFRIYSYFLSDTLYPLAGSTISAGFPAYAENFKTEPVSIDKFLVEKPESTYIIQVSGESMIDAGIFPESFIVVDTSIKPVNNAIVVARYFDEFIVKRIKIFPDHAVLVAENANRNYPKIHIDETTDFEVWGTVVGTFKKLK
jgi:DNA polymerase V